MVCQRGVSSLAHISCAIDLNQVTGRDTNSYFSIHMLNILAKVPVLLMIKSYDWNEVEFINE